MEQALVPLNLEETMTLGDVLAKSGFFKDTKQASQAVVKVLAGREIGFGPIASMTGVHIVQGKPVIGANLIAAKVKAHPAYDYQITENTDTRCEIAFYQGGAEVGRSSFTMDDARAAGLMGKDVWKKYPRNMLFARAISNGARWHCPDVFSGVTVYTPEELDAGNGHDIIDVTPTPTDAPPSNGPEWTAPAVEAGEDSPPTQATMELPSDTPTKPATLLDAANAATGGYYNHPAHLLNGIRTHLGDEWRWPVNDPAAYAEALQVAIDHAKANQS